MSSYQPHQYLRDLAGHFERRDWEWTRDLGGIEHIRHQGDWTGYDAPWRRLLRVLRRLTEGRRGTLFGPRAGEWWSWARATVTVGLRTENHLPDGRLDGSGGILCTWEEDGEYIQVVQPSVGLLLADFLESDPTHPIAVAISAEIERIATNYEQRAGES